MRVVYKESIVDNIIRELNSVHKVGLRISRVELTKGEMRKFNEEMDNNYMTATLYRKSMKLLGLTITEEES